MDQEVLTNLVGVIWKVSLDGIVIRGRTSEDLPQNLLTALQRLVDRGLFAAAHECNLFTWSATSCGKAYSSESIAYLRERMEGLVNTRRPATKGEMIQFLQAAKWMRTFPPRLVGAIGPLRELSEVLAKTSRTKRLAKNRRIIEEDWKTGTVDHIMREIKRTFKALLNKWRHPLGDWVQGAPVVWWALNAAYRGRYHACLYKMSFGREPGRPSAITAELGGE